MKRGAAIANWLIPGGLEIPLAWCFFVFYMFGSEVSTKSPNNLWFELSFGTGLALCVTSWVIKDARQRGIHGCYDLDTFVFSGWTVALPVYLFCTRGVRAFATLGLFLLLVLSASVAGVLLAIPFKGSQ